MVKSRARASVFFDLDGTLTDSQEGITRSIQYALERLDCDVPPAAELRWCLGPPLLESFGSMIGHERADRALALYRERFTDVGWSENRPYPGVADVLAELFASGFALHVATSKPRVFAERILGHFDFTRYFHAIFGSELDGRRTDKSELLHFALSESGVEGPSTMIGDRCHDIDGAKSNGMRAIGVTYGYGTIDELMAAGTLELADRPEDLLLLLR